MELIDYFQQGKGQTALVGSTLMGTHLIFGKIYWLMVYSDRAKANAKEQTILDASFPFAFV